MNTEVFQYKYSLQVPQPQSTFIIMRTPASVVLATPTLGNGSKTYAVSKNGFATNINHQQTENHFINHEFMSKYPFLNVVEEETVPYDNLKMPNCSDPHLSPELMNEDFFDIDDKFLQDLLQPEDDFIMESYGLDTIELDDGCGLKEYPDSLNLLSSQSPDSFEFSPSQSPNSLNFSSSQSPNSFNLSASESPLINEFDEPIMESESYFKSSPASSSDDLATYFDNNLSSSESFVESEFGDQEDIANIYLLPDNEDSIEQSLEDDLIFSIDEDLEDFNLGLTPLNTTNKTKRKSVFSPEERRERKKASNRFAAYRYRQKQKVKVSDVEGELKEKIAELRREQGLLNEKRQTINMLKKLATEVIEARRRKRC